MAATQSPHRVAAFAPLGHASGPAATAGQSWDTSSSVALCSAASSERIDLQVRPSRGSETVLLAEDEEGVRTLVGEILSRRGYRVIPARDGLEALALARRFEGEISLLITDVVMPGMDGKELARALEALRPSTRVLFISGFVKENPEGLDETLTSRFLAKPFSAAALLQAVADLLASGDVTRS